MDRERREEMQAVLRGYREAAWNLPFLSIRVELRLERSLNTRFPAALLRGALGNVLRLQECPSGGASLCDETVLCPYCDLFESRIVEGDDSWTRGQRTVPRPLAIIAEPDDWRRGRFTILLIGKSIPHAGIVLEAFRRAGRLGLGAERVRFQIAGAHDVGGHERWAPRIVGELARQAEGRLAMASRLRVTTVSPLRLKVGGQWCRRPDLRVIVVNAARRFAALSLHHGDGSSLPPPPHFLLSLLAEARTLEEAWSWEDRRRFSSRQSRHHKLGGAVGSALFPNAHPSVPFFLALAEALGVGKATPFGFGRVEVNSGE